MYEKLQQMWLFFLYNQISADKHRQTESHLIPRLKNNVIEKCVTYHFYFSF